jgi:hypothetical protein
VGLLRGTDGTKGSTMHRSRTITFAAIAIVAAIAFLEFTAPGHHVLNALGFATADCGNSGC